MIALSNPWELFHIVKSNNLPASQYNELSLYSHREISMSFSDLGLENGSVNSSYIYN